MFGLSKKLSMMFSSVFSSVQPDNPQLSPKDIPIPWVPMSSLVLVPVYFIILFLLRNLSPFAGSSRLLTTIIYYIFLAFLCC